VFLIPAVPVPMTSLRICRTLLTTRICRSAGCVRGGLVLSKSGTPSARRGFGNRHLPPANDIMTARTLWKRQDLCIVRKEKSKRNAREELIKRICAAATKKYSFQMTCMTQRPSPQMTPMTCYHHQITLFPTKHLTVVIRSHFWGRSLEWPLLYSVSD
jgi:hypothetical protein